MNDAKKILESLNADELRQRLDQLNDEREATLVLLRGEPHGAPSPQTGRAFGQGGGKVIAPGYISAHEVYRLAEAKRRLNMGRHSFRLLREVGLPVLKVGRNCYVDGGAVVDALKKSR